MYDDLCSIGDSDAPLIIFRIPSIVASQGYLPARKHVLVDIFDDRVFCALTLAHISINHMWSPPDARLIIVQKRLAIHFRRFPAWTVGYPLDC